MVRKGPGHGLRGTARTKKGGGVDRRRDGDARKEGNALRHTRNCNSFARGVNAVWERPRENRKNPKIGRCGSVLVRTTPDRGILLLLLRSVTQDSRYAGTRTNPLPLRFENCKSNSRCSTFRKATIEENYDNAHYFRKLNKINITLWQIFFLKKNQLLNI